MRKIIYLLLILGFIYSCTENQSSINESTTIEKPSPERFVDIGTHRVHINDFGQGSPGVVFVTGTGGDIGQWNRQVHEIDKHTRVIVYDRAGIGKTESYTSNRSLKSMVNELYLTLEKENVQGPIILVAHSMGGSIIRYYQHLHPDNVVGMIFIDALGYDYAGRYDDFPEKGIKWSNEIDSISQIYQGGVKDEMQFLKHRDNRRDTLLQIGYPKNIPIKIILSMLGEEGIVGEQYIKKQDSLYTEMAANDPLIDLIKTNKTGHFIHWYEPRLVNETIIDLINEIRKE
jgi:pimeloyl-ACP methyl ester carboxylesterase